MATIMCWLEGCITFDGVGTLTEIEGTMNTTKYLETPSDNVWSVIAKKNVRTVGTSFKMIMHHVMPLTELFTGREKMN